MIEHVFASVTNCCCETQPQGTQDFARCWKSPRRKHLYQCMSTVRRTLLHTCQTMVIFGDIIQTLINLIVTTTCLNPTWTIKPTINWTGHWSELYHQKQSVTDIHSLNPQNSMQHALTCKRSFQKVVIVTSLRTQYKMMGKVDIF